MMGMFKKSLRTTKGSIIADAAVSLPLFILAIAALLSLMVRVYLEEQAYASLSENTIILSYESSLDSALDYKCEYQAVGKNTMICLVYRPFVSECTSRQNDAFVYIYRKSGTKYHQKNCSVLNYKNDYEQVSLSEAENLGYTPCELCRVGGFDYFKKR